VPGNASGGMDGVQVKPLTVGFHETQFLGKLNGENQAGFWFQLSDEERQQVGSPWGPSNPQALNRYSYVQNNPLKYTDPSGHQAQPGVYKGKFDEGNIDNLTTAIDVNIGNLGWLAVIAGVAGAAGILTGVGGLAGLAGLAAATYAGEAAFELSQVKGILNKLEYYGASSYSKLTGVVKF